MNLCPINSKVFFLDFIEYVYILSRTKTVDDDKKMDLYDILKQHDLPFKYLVEVEQEDEKCKEF